MIGARIAQKLGYTGIMTNTWPSVGLYYDTTYTVVDGPVSCPILSYPAVFCLYCLCILYQTATAALHPEGQVPRLFFALFSDCSLLSSYGSKAKCTCPLFGGSNRTRTYKAPDNHYRPSKLHSFILRTACGFLFRNDSARELRSAKPDI
jgi:hypothetical protein